MRKSKKNLLKSLIEWQNMDIPCRKIGNNYLVYTK
ncbi:hypothetical protein EV199_4913 [Pseudobacter ginsenosidimutans]|uniref:Uncharacterized protein n=1 Tax=Pseudobacter ginsenosidimutans TaxID=661488 RepID=A0A4Q7MND8_9BACT|nr:hypothetical protein EV199_4913 [Pseudobacter ginsenosidimutans]